LGARGVTRTLGWGWKACVSSKKNFGLKTPTGGGDRNTQEWGIKTGKQPDSRNSGLHSEVFKARKGRLWHDARWRKSFGGIGGARKARSGHKLLKGREWDRCHAILDLGPQGKINRKEKVSNQDAGAAITVKGTMGRPD